MLNKTHSSRPITLAVVPAGEASKTMMLSPAPASKPVYVAPGAGVTIECLSNRGKGEWLYSRELIYEKFNTFYKC